MAVYQVTRKYARRIMRKVHAERCRLAAEALRKARATMECEESKDMLDDCPRYAVLVGYEWLDWYRIIDHWAYASALLDGFSVREVTNAGG